MSFNRNECRCNEFIAEENEKQSIDEVGEKRNRSSLLRIDVLISKKSKLQSSSSKSSPCISIISYLGLYQLYQVCVVQH